MAWIVVFATGKQHTIKHIEKKELGFICPVSYTHLDVYKRQASQSVIFYCTHGGSSMKLARYLGNRGFDTATVIGGYLSLIHI